MANVYIMKILFAIICCINIFLPFYRDWKFHFSIFQVLILIFWFIGLLGGLGYFNQSTPIVQIGLIRIVQICIYLLFKFKLINWVIIGIFLFFDIAFLMLLLFDKANYEYVTEEKINGNK